MILIEPEIVLSKLLTHPTVFGECDQTEYVLTSQGPHVQSLSWVAQLVERSAVNRLVGGSSPSPGANFCPVL